MCGLVGLIGLKGAVPRLPPLAFMAQALDHRGPDGEGYFLKGAVGLYHKRLAIIDLKTGQQPMASGHNLIVFNGEIYNYLELREELKARGHRFLTDSDTEVLLKMYEEHGPQFIDRLDGMFAFLLYDQKARRLLAARDHFGIKPLYYALHGDFLIYASEIKAILRHPGFRAEPDWRQLHDYLVLQLQLGEGTMFQGIRKVLPGHYQVVELPSGAMRSVRYWEPRFRVDGDHTEEYFQHTLREAIEETVRLQMRSDVPVGSYLSGGLDSSVVSVLAAAQARLAGGRLATFSGAFREGPEFNELEYAREVGRATGVQMHEVFPTVRQFQELLPGLIYHMDEPVAGPGLFPQYVVSRLAAEKVKVVLGGQGGDEIFGGYARYIVAYLEQALKGAIFETNEEGEHIVSLKSILPNLSYLKQYVPMLRYLWSQEVFEPMDRRYFRLIDRSNGWGELYTPEFAAQHDKEELFARFQTLFNHPDTKSYYNKMTHFDMVASLPALLQVEDRVSMAASLESRVPLLDRKIVDLVTSMPPALKFKGGEMKYIYKKAIRDLLPPKVHERKDKMGFPVPLHLWSRQGARGFISDVLFSESSRTRGIIDTARVEKLIDSEKPFGRQLWGLLCLELWFQTFIDRPPTKGERHAEHIERQPVAALEG